MKYVVIEGVAVPAVLASSFNDPSPSKRPFSYTKPLPPCSQALVQLVTSRALVTTPTPTPTLTLTSTPAPAPAPSATATATTTATTTAIVATEAAPSHIATRFSSRKSHLSIPRVLPLLPYEAMPSNIQYNTPMPIYSREAAEEQYKQQVGVGPQQVLGARDRHFDPEKSETLKVIRAGEADDFGRHFHEQIAQAEAPHIPPPQEPYWAQTARSRRERARSATPSATYTTPSTQPYYALRYSTLQHPKKRSEQRFYPATKRGYEFGGLDYVDRSRIPQDSFYKHYEYSHRPSEERKTTPGYEMGGVDFRKGAIPPGGSYHGHGPEHRRLQSKFEHTPLKHDEMNIEVAPNIDSVSADIVVGDTRSNQHLTKDQHPDHSFGTSFGPTAGFTHQHRAVNRTEETPKSSTFSLSAKKGSNTSRTGDSYRTTLPTSEPVNPPTELAGYTSQVVANYTSHGSGGTHGGTSAPFRKVEQAWSRSQSAAPVDRYEWANESDQKEVTIETLLNGRALLARKRSVTPEWQSRSLEKHNQWKNRLDPRLTRSQTYDQEPTWSRIVSNRRNAWEEKARNIDARVQMPPSSKIPPQQLPHWCNKANQMHTLWQSEADRQSRNLSEYGNTTHTSQNYAEYSSNQRRYEQYGTDIRPTDKYDGFMSQTQYTNRMGDNDLEKVPRSQAPYHTSYSISERQHYTSEQSIPAKESMHTNYSSVPVAVQHTESSKIQQESPFWQSQNNSRYEQKIRERSTESTVTPVAAQSAGTYGIEKTSYQRRTYHETTAPFTTSAVSVTEGSGDFNRRSEMAEVLPKGTIANTEASTEGKYVDNEGRPVSYKRELVTSVNPNSESTLLKEEESRVVETPLEPGVISRHVTTKYYKKKTVTDTMTTTNIIQ